MELADLARRRIDWILSILLVGIASVVLLPQLGAFPLWDPWETQYTQVAWEMGQRGTWIDPYYQNLDNWWSKPIFTLWLLRASLSAFWDPSTELFDVQLVARLPFALFAILGGVLQYDWGRRLFGRTTGFLSALILLTAPQYLLVGRQVMTDIPFVVATSASLGYLGVGLFTSPTVEPMQPPAQGRVSAFFCRGWPFLLFWFFQAIAVLTKGFVAPVLALGVLGIHAVTSYPRSGAAQRLSTGSGQPSRTRLFWSVLVLACLVLLVSEIHRRTGLVADQKRLLTAGWVGVALLVLGLCVWGDTGPGRHVRQLLGRIQLGWGLLLFSLLTVPWFLHMTLRHGWPYWESFIFYHHLGRAAGEISKPSGSFDFLVKHLAFGLFPWTALLVPGLGRLVNGPSDGDRDPREGFLLSLWIVPFVFFAMSATKLAHYGMPLLPPAALIVARLLARWTERPAVPERSSQTRWLQAAVALAALLVLCIDVWRDPRALLRVFVYYHNRPTPSAYRPETVLFWCLVPLVVSLVVYAWRSQRRPFPIWPWGLSTLVLACHLSWVAMPAMGATYTYQPLLLAYEKARASGERLGQFCAWSMPERSVVFFSQNEVVHLKDEAKTRAFLQGPERRFVLVDRDRISELGRIAKGLGQQLHLISADHPFARLFSNQPSQAQKERARRNVLTELPADVVRNETRFADHIRLLGWKTKPQPVLRGTSVEVRLYFTVDAPVTKDYQIFVHAEGANRSTRRILADHNPVEGLWPTSSWKPGTIIQDVFSIDIPKDYPDGFMFLWTGLFIDNQRLPVVLAQDVDREERIRGPFVRVRRQKRR